jgi:polyhydroxyalkanoate synthase
MTTTSFPKMEKKYSPDWEEWQSSLFNESFANLRRYASLPFLPEKVDKVRKGVTPREVVYEEDRVTLYRYLGDKPPTHKTPLCFVFALVNRPYIFDLKENRSVISHFVNAGFDTYLIDWGIPTRAERFLTTDDYVNGYMLNVVKYLCERSGKDQVHMLGYCMGGTLSTIFTAIHQKLVRNLILLTTGINFDTDEGLINLWTNPKYFDVDKFVDTIGNVPAEFLQNAFLMLKPIQNLVQKPINLAENIHDEKFLEDYLYMETWLNDNIAIPGEVYREFGKYLFQQNLLVKGKLPIGRHIVNMKNITCPVLNLMAKNDDLVPNSQSDCVENLIGSEDKETIVWPTGHIGLAVSGRAQKELWPEVVNWLEKRSD